MMKKFAFIFALGSALGATAFATANNCGTPADDAGSTNPTTAISLDAANTYDNSDLGTDAGCQVINKVFDNFAISAGTGTTANIQLLGTDPSAAGIQQNLLFSPTASSGVDWNSNGSDVTTEITFLVTPVLGSGTFGVSGVGINASSMTGADTVSVRILACFSQTTICTTGAGDAQFDQTFTTPLLANGLSTFGGGAFSSLQSNAYTVRLIATVHDGGSGFVDLNNFYVEFTDTPEPSTFGMLGSALIGLGFLAHRRRRKG